MTKNDMISSKQDGRREFDSAMGRRMGERESG